MGQQKQEEEEEEMEQEGKKGPKKHLGYTRGE